MMEITEDDIDNMSLDELQELGSKLDGGSSPSYGAPKQISKDTIFKFFKEILISTDSRKTGNLKENELGQMSLPVRGYLSVASYAKAEGLERVASYLIEQAEITSSTSMSRKGFLAQLFVTQIKKEQKLKEPKFKKTLFGGIKEIKEGGE